MKIFAAVLGTEIAGMFGVELTVIVSFVFRRFTSTVPDEYVVANVGVVCVEPAVLNTTKTSSVPFVRA